MPSAARRRALPRAVLLAFSLSLAPLAACYRAAPLAGPAAAPTGRRVIVSLTAQGTQDLASQLGPGVVRAEGVVIAAAPDGIELALTRTELGTGTDQLWQQQRVRVPHAAVATLSERRLDRVRSWLAAAGIVALAALAATIVGGELGGDRSGPIDSGTS